MMKLSLHHTSLTLLIGVLFYINSIHSALDSCTIASNVATLSTCNVSCLWEDPVIWKSCSTNSFPDANDNAAINVTGGYTLNISTTNIALGDMSLGSGSANAKGVNTQVVVINNVCLSAKSIKVQNRGVLDLDLDKISTNNNISTTMDMTFNSGSSLIWRSGTIGINSVGSNQYNAFTLNEGSTLTVTGGSVTLARDLTSKGNQTLLSGSVITITSKRTLTFDTPSYTIFNDQTTIQDSTGLENLALKGNVQFNLGLNTVNFNVLTAVTQKLTLNSGVIKFNRNSTLAGLAIKSAATIEFHTPGITTISSIGVSEQGSLSWNDGDIRISASGVVENNGTTTFQSIKDQARIYSDSPTTITNRGYLVISTPVIIRSTALVVYGGLVTLPTTAEIATIKLIAGIIQPVTGPSEINVGSEFTATGGVLGGVTLNAQGSFSMKDTNVSGAIININSIGSVPATIGGTISITNTNTFNINSTSVADFQSAVINSIGEDVTSTINNYGILQGKVTLDKVSVTNYGTIGATYSNSNPITYISVKNTGLKMDPLSNTYIDISSDLTKSEILVDGGNNKASLELAGNLTIRLRKAFTPESDTSITFISWSPTTTLTGDFANVYVDRSVWPNANGCSAINVVKDTSKRNYKITFGGCGTHSAGPIIKSVSKTTTILIVLVIVFLIGVCIFFIAWCKKKYKKKPWDRLKDDRF